MLHNKFANVELKLEIGLNGHIIVQQIDNSKVEEEDVMHSTGMRVLLAKLDHSFGKIVHDLRDEGYIDDLMYEGVSVKRCLHVYGGDFTD